MGDETSRSYGSYTLGDRSTVTVGSSPFILRNPFNTPAEIFIAGGTVTLIEFSRDGDTWESCGLFSGQYRLNPGDSLRITWLVMPTVVAYPF